MRDKIWRSFPNESKISYNLLYHFILGPSAVGFEEDGHFSGHAAGGHDIPVSTTFAAE